VTVGGRYERQRRRSNDEREVTKLECGDSDYPIGTAFVILHSAVLRADAQ
jgi:hypothetical protein